MTASVTAGTYSAAQEAEREDFVEGKLRQYGNLASTALFDVLPKRSPTYLYDLITAYPQRPGKGLRAAICLATCNAFKGRVEKALNSAVAIELFHNAFLIHDDVQDQSDRRRGGATLNAEYGPAIAINVGNAMNLIALHQLMANRNILGQNLTWRVATETEEMLRHTLEGQALELGWIRDNTCDLAEDDYYRMCLKKTSWYTCIYPCRVGALIANNGAIKPYQFYHFGWYLGAAFQIQDDVLNLIGDYAKYGKEIGGDLWEGKRTLMLIHLLRHSKRVEKKAIRAFLGKRRQERTPEEVAWLHELMVARGSIDFAKSCARQLADAALQAGLVAFQTAHDNEDKRFLLELPLYVINRER